MNRVAVAAAAMFVLIGSTSCSRPFTDIVATNTEAVGPYRVVASADDGRLSGRLCVADPSSADEIARRVFEQVKNHHYATIVLDVYARNGPVAQYVWAGEGFARRAAPGGVNPCLAGERGAPAS